MANTTTNMGSATANWTMNWGDGTSADTIANINAAGGTSGARLAHTWGQGTSSGTGRDTFTLTLADTPQQIPILPVTGTQLVKVYNDDPVVPNGLSSKTLPNVSSVGTSPKLAHGFTDRTGGASTSVGATVAPPNKWHSNSRPSCKSFAYRADSGTLTANTANGSADGSKHLQQMMIVALTQVW